jgi:hypothetical protein
MALRVPLLSPGPEMQPGAAACYCCVLQASPCTQQRVVDVVRWFLARDVSEIEHLIKLRCCTIDRSETRNTTDVKSAANTRKDARITVIDAT